MSRDMIDEHLNQYGKLIVFERWGVDKQGRVMWLCQCKCGEQKVIRGSCLRSGETKSCGCLRSERASKIKFKHGHYTGGRGSPTWISWYDMRKRVNNKNSTGYKYYGGRGIKVCEQWNDFKIFLKDMGERPIGKTIDRINNDGHYEPNNCRRSTPKEQQANRRSRETCNDCKHFKANGLDERVCSVNVIGSVSNPNECAKFDKKKKLIYNYRTVFVPGE